MAIASPFLATATAATVLLVLVGRNRLHQFSREQLTPDEIRATTTMFVLALAVLPFLPNRAIDPWNLFNPQLFGVLVLIIAAIQFGGYVAIRVFGQNLGMILTGFFGGLVSSTAVFITLPHLVKDRPEITHAAIAAGILATVGMLVELVVEYMAWKLGRPLITVACNEDMTASDLVGRYLLEANGTRSLGGPLT